ncbi:hypothetical protein C0J52_19302 [Blattella germanica]|nr:hypothetical protein C0J52_19302 [Blattella germanica]
MLFNSSHCLSDGEIKQLQYGHFKRMTEDSDIQRGCCRERKVKDDIAGISIENHASQGFSKGLECMKELGTET